jgi:ribulose-5-phosphate 4-epimerase/fuculose-1-phosphate aldolase
MAEVLGGHPAIFLRNHGVVFCGETIEDMTVAGVQLETACRELLMIRSSGLAWGWPEDAEQARKFTTMGGRNVELFFKYFARKLAATTALGHPSLPRERTMDS